MAQKLTAAEVANKRFTPVRLREGYSMDEVDAFLDDVEATLSGVETEIKDMHAQMREQADLVHASTPEETSGMSAEMQSTQQDLISARQKITRLEKELELAKAKPAPTGGTSLADASAASTRMLEMAAKQHDDLIAEGKKASDRAISDAEKEATRLLNDAKASARDEETRIAAERAEKLGKLEQDRSQLEKIIATLRRVENESRDALRVHFAERLTALDESVVDRIEAKNQSNDATKETPSFFES